MAIWLLILPFLFILPFLGKYIYSPGSQYSDVLITHIPNAIFLKQSISQFTQVPLWSNTILSGYPFAANPLSGLWYPPGWLGMFLPYPFGFNICVVIHLILGGFGMYLFLRSQGLSKMGSLLGAILFEALPKVIAHLAAGHVTLLYAYSWTPWLLWVEQLTGNHFSWKKVIIGPGFILGMILLADIRWGAYAGLLWVVFSTFHAVNRSKRVLSERFRILPSWLIRIGIQGVAALAVAAPLLIPLVEYTRLSTRAALTSTDVFTLSLPPIRLLGLLYPAFGASAEWVVYFTGTGFIFFLTALIVDSVRKKVTFWIGVFLFSIVFSLGSNLPGLTALAKLPVINLLRVPTRAMLVAGFAIAVIVGTVIDVKWKKKAVSQKGQYNPVLLPVTLAAFIGMLTIGIAVINHGLALNFAWGAVAACLASGLLALRMMSKLPDLVWITSVFLLVLVDLTGVNYLAVSPTAKPIADDLSQSITDYLRQQPGQFRVYSPTYSISQLAAAQSKLELADGIDPLQLTAYRDYMAVATGITNTAYSVTLPPYATGDPSQNNVGSLPDPILLGRLNVEYIVANYTINHPDLSLVYSEGDAQIYRNRAASPRAWVDASSKKAEIVEYSPNLIKIQASGPGNLVLSEISYPGWTVNIDDQAAALLTIDGLLRGVTLSAGTHVITFKYKPLGVTVGIVVAVIAWLGFGLAFFKLVRRKE